jgi:hypothetical protein
MELRLETGFRPALSSAAVCAVAVTALAVAMAVGRFAFTAMLPLMIRDGLIVAQTGSWLAASNYLGYLMGALTASRIAASPQAIMYGSLLGIAALTAAMGLPGGAAFWIALRFAAGVLSAWALVATSTWALGHLARVGRLNLAGIVYAGVGLGIVFVGGFCLIAAQPGVTSAMLWLALGGIAALAAILPTFLLARDRFRFPKPSPAPGAGGIIEAGNFGLVICYGALGFGYILPATFLPALAREVIDDPQIFGLAWPLFGAAAAISTVVTVWTAPRANRLRLWAASHVVMAAGVILPSLWLSTATIGIAALFVGSTFMVATMFGLQEARARQPANPTRILAGMTAAFAIGQLAGPLATGVLSLLPVGHAAVLDAGLIVAAFALAVSAAYLWTQASHPARQEARPS